jgi:hypothetical protein
VNSSLTSTMASCLPDTYPPEFGGSGCALLQEYGAAPDSSKNKGDGLGSAAGESGGSSKQPAGQLPSLLPEEVLMYHRASSRLAELCAVVGQ